LTSPNKFILTWTWSEYICFSGMYTVHKCYDLCFASQRVWEYKLSCSNQIRLDENYNGTKWMFGFAHEGIKNK
jgi:hypothetical protein